MQRCRFCSGGLGVALGGGRYFSSAPIAPQYVFNGRAKLLQRARAASAPDFGEYEYLRDEVASRLVGRLFDISREFPVALDLGSNAGNVLGQLMAQRTGEGRLPGGIETLHQLEPCAHLAAAGGAKALPSEPPSSGLTVLPRLGPIDGAPLPYEDASLDLVMSSMALHWVNDVPFLLAEVLRVLKPDGVFICAFLGGDTLQELR
jgi:NADH dehydrogenase [ubiquinone] 1 alpha subcomplex assembly factor 5